MRYQVRALSGDHLFRTLKVEARDEMEARRQVTEMGLFVSAVESAPAVSFKGVGERKRSPVQLILFSQELLALLKAGLSLVECLEALLEKEQNLTLESVLCQLLDGLKEGKRFSAVLSEQPEVFPVLYVSLVRAAEETSDLCGALQKYIVFRERVDAVRGKIVGAAIYPAILMTVGGGISLFMLVYVVPRFADVYQDSGRDLPLVTAVMFSAGTFMADHLGTMLFSLAVGGVAAWMWFRRWAGVGDWSRICAAIPGVSERVRIYQLSRLYMTLGMLLDGGIAVVPALRSASGMVSAQMRVQLEQARLAIQAGEDLSTAFERHQLTTPISRRMLRIGERSGQLGTMLAQSAAFYDGEIGRWIDRFTRTFEPVLMAAIGLLVGAIVVMLYMPIFDLAGGV